MIMAMKDILLNVKYFIWDAKSFVTQLTIPSVYNGDVYCLNFPSPNFWIIKTNKNNISLEI